MSKYLLIDATFPPCDGIDKKYGTGGNCLVVNVVIGIGYWFNVAAFVLMLLSGFDGSPTAKYIHRRIFPFDQRPPPSCECLR